LLGYVGFRILKHTAHVATLAVHPEWRGRGIGEYLLLVAITEGLTEGKRRVTLEVRPSNRAAQALYRKLGFERTGIRRAYYRNGEDGWIMTLGPIDTTAGDQLRARLETTRTRLMEQFTQGR
jgi:ribosomal-protein-alanine N-acetyltransferase